MMTEIIVFISHCKLVTIYKKPSTRCVLCKFKLPGLSQSASKLYRTSDRRLSAKLVPTFADRVCHVVSVTDPYGHVLGFLYRSR
jgi:hypothetical protein